MYLNRMLEKIDKHELAIGCHIKWDSSMAVDILAKSGFDYLWLDGEHGIFDRSMICDYIRAAQLNNVATFYRIPYNVPTLCKPILEMGVDGIIFPMINTAEQAREAVSSVLYPPEGNRGFGPGMAIDYGMMSFDDYFEKEKNVWRIIQIEHIEAVKNIDEILSVEGISAVIVGMYDLSGSMGCLADLQNNQVLETVDYIADKCHQYHIPVGSSISYDETLLHQWKNRGADFMTIGGDQDFLVEGSRRTINGTLKIFGEGNN